MITAIDSSVLWAIIKQEAGWEAWENALLHAASEGPLIICPIAFAELAPSAPDEASLHGFLGALAIHYDDLSPAAAFASGQTFKRYRKAGGPRQHLVPISPSARTRKPRRTGWRPSIAATSANGSQASRCWHPGSRELLAVIRAWLCSREARTPSACRRGDV